MKRAGATVTTLAREMGISYQAVKKVVDGTSTSFSAANNAEAAQVLKLNPDWLATGKGSMNAADTNIAPAQIGAPEPPSLQSTLALLSAIVATSDDLTRDQLKPLFNRMLDEPQRAAEIVQRIESVISSSTGGRTSKLTNQDMPGFLKK